MANFLSSALLPRAGSGPWSALLQETFDDLHGPPLDEGHVIGSGDYGELGVGEKAQHFDDALGENDVAVADDEECARCASSPFMCDGPARSRRPHSVLPT